MIRQIIPTVPFEFKCQQVPQLFAIVIAHKRGSTPFSLFVSNTNSDVLSIDDSYCVELSAEANKESDKGTLDSSIDSIVVVDLLLSDDISFFIDT